MSSTEARELELVGKVEMRIALATDDKLESLLKPYLPALLLKLGSEHAAVRNKVRTRDRLLRLCTYLTTYSTCSSKLLQLLTGPCKFRLLLPASISRSDLLETMTLSSRLPLC